MKHGFGFPGTDSQSPAGGQSPVVAHAEICSVAAIGRQKFAIQIGLDPIPTDAQLDCVFLPVNQSLIFDPGGIVASRLPANVLKTSQVLSPGVDIEGSLSTTGNKQQRDRVLTGSTSKRDFKVVFTLRLNRQHDS